jgi:hypothetical protein
MLHGCVASSGLHNYWPCQIRFTYLHLLLTAQNISTSSEPWLHPNTLIARPGSPQKGAYLAGWVMELLLDEVDLPLELEEDEEDDDEEDEELPSRSNPR